MRHIRISALIICCLAALLACAPGLAEQRLGRLPPDAGRPAELPFRPFDARTKRTLLTLGTQIFGGKSDPEAAQEIARRFFRYNPRRIKREEPITVVIGNPPYKEKAKGRGAWIEGEHEEAEKSPPLAEWMPPKLVADDGS